MKLTMRQILESIPAIQSFVNKYEVGIGAATIFSRNIRAINEMTKVHEEKRIELLNKYGIKPEKEGDTYTFETPEKKAKFMEDFATHMNTELEVSIQTIPTIMLDNLKLKIEEIAPFDFMITLYDPTSK